MERYELAVIGGGPAGYHGAAYASDAGMKTVLFEGDKLGGTCLNRGCIPTKTFLHSAKLLKNAKKGTVYGVNVQTEGLDHTAVNEHYWQGRKGQSLSWWQALLPPRKGPAWM